jgi:hypothetical protein
MTVPSEPHDRGDERSPQLQAFEAQLAALRPRDDRLKRDRLMYLAGQASGRADVDATTRPHRSRWAIPASIGAASGALAVSLLMAFAPLSLPMNPGGTGTPDAPIAMVATGDLPALASTTEWRIQMLLQPSVWADASLSTAGVVRMGEARRSVDPVVDLEPRDARPPFTSRSVNEALQTLAPADRS